MLRATGDDCTRAIASTPGLYILIDVAGCLRRSSNFGCDFDFSSDGTDKRIFVERIQVALELIALSPYDDASQAVNCKSRNNSNPIRLLAGSVLAPETIMLTTRCHRASQFGESPIQ